MLFRSSYINKILFFLLPPTCIKCHKELGNEGALCGDCWQAMHFISHPYCEDCGVPFEYAQVNTQVCDVCMTYPQVISKSRSALVYDDGCKSMIMRLKYGDATYLANESGRWMASHGKDCLKGADFLIPVPLHRWRLLTRRYNQATLLARSLSKHCGVPLLVNELVRYKRTISQGHMSFLQRKGNVHQAFALKPRAYSLVKGKCCVLIDDVKTTGATLNECARVLLASGAKEVRAITLALVKHEEKDQINSEA